MTARRGFQGPFAVLVMAAGLAGGQEHQPTSSASRQSMDDAWWTGPMLAPSAATLPHGHFLIEPYLYDVTVQGRYDADGVGRSTPHANGFGSLAYLLYGLVDRLSVGLIPTAGYNVLSGGPNSSGVGLGDVSLQAQYRLTQFHEGRGIPTISFNIQEAFPTGKYDQLGRRPSDGFGGGSYTTTLALYSQMFFWLPNGRILRMRFNVAGQAFSSTVNLRDASVYGTDAGFRGHANPGRALFVDLSGEYSVTRRWVLALDVTYRHAGNTVVGGDDVLHPASAPIRLDLGTSDAFGLAPAIEYSWKGNLGVLLGVRLFPAGRNAAVTITPAIAINYVR